MNTFCTIVNESYIPFANAVYSSITEHTGECQLYVLVVDSEKEFIEENNSNIYWVRLGTIIQSETANIVIRKYLHKTKENELRWALKPIFIAWLLTKGIKKVIYTDPDVFFVGSAEFLFDRLDDHAIILTPHWQNITPDNSNHFISLLRSGYFNAGFIGASSSGIRAINWWAEACSFRMEKSMKEGLYDDQKFLDLMPLEFESVGIIKHKGCNIAIWNMDTNKRKIVDNKLVIAGEYEPVFIHFTKDTIQNIISGNDRLLLPFLEKYKMTLGEITFRNSLSIEPALLRKKNYFIYIKGKLLIRTRIKRFLYRLSEWL